MGLYTAKSLRMLFQDISAEKIFLLFFVSSVDVKQHFNNNIRRLPPHYITTPVLLSGVPNLPWPSATNSATCLTLHESIVHTNRFGVNQVPTGPKPDRYNSSLSSHSLLFPLPPPPPHIYTSVCLSVCLSASLQLFSVFTLPSLSPSSPPPHIYTSVCLSLSLKIQV